MSRTDVHRPFKALINDPTIRHWFLDHHDHIKGPCDLEQYLATRAWVRTRCYRQTWSAAPSLCGCFLCRGPVHLYRKQVRVTWRKIRQDLLKTAPQDRGDMDVPPLQGSSW